ncbi:MAG: putative Ig domain-containing protein [Phenylobacterium sp.]|uniref:Ig domain-containing protein n=1 Tax=Phenylobacterium sp. TaxID=1871053 RepID=UPI001A1D6997|nr:Ig domain-containing protein [Phenylobacterium sp.]MBJ7410839.1 putative Ig domain-containing protein [Phenylobacterium sp.]
MSIGIRLGVGMMIPASARPGPTTAPVNTRLPGFIGVRTVGQPLTFDPGDWSGLPSGVFGYRVLRNGVAIVDPASSPYTPVSGDVGANTLKLEVTATNSQGSTTVESLPISIAAALSISGAPPAANVGIAYTFAPTSAGGHTPKTYALTGTLPPGLSFNTATGAITGTPLSTGTASGLNITVTDADGLTASLGTFSLTVSTGYSPSLDFRDERNSQYAALLLELF